MSYLGNSPGVASQRVESSFTATAGQTAFIPLAGYTIGYCDVFLNGVKLISGVDYTAADGVSVVLGSGAAAGDTLEVLAYFPRGLTDGYTKPEADSRFVNTAGGTMTGAIAFAAGQTFAGTQPTLVSGTNIKTINGTSVLGSGDIVAGFSADANSSLNASGTIDSPAGTGSITMLGLLQPNVSSSVAIGFGSSVGSSWSTAIGRQATTAGNSAISIGAASKASTEGAIAIGGGQMPFLLDGAQATGTEYPIAVGYLSLASSGTGIAIGRQAQATNDRNFGNIALGDRSTASATYAVAIGRLALGSGVGAVAIGGGPNTFMQTKAVGSGAVAIGQSAFASGSTSIAIGLSADCNNQDSVVIGASSFSYNNNTIVIGRSVGSSAANQITLGNSSITQLRCQVTTITSLSDARDKIVDGKLRAGLDFVNRLNAYDFTWNTRDGAKVGIKDTGFLAQDLKRVQEETGISIPDLVSEIDPEKLEAGYGKLIPIYAVAIQELSNLVDELRSEIQQLKKGI